jgi:hypothetical protein
MYPKIGCGVPWRFFAKIGAQKFLDRQEETGALPNGKIANRL